jgi:hypothetical protein
MPADAGIVMIQAMTMLPATAQRTADEPLSVPTPIGFGFVIQCGRPKSAAARFVASVLFA